MSETTDNRITVRVAEAADLLGISIGTLRLWTKHNRVPHWREGGTVMFSVDALREWAKDKSAAKV